MRQSVLAVAAVATLAAAFGLSLKRTSGDAPAAPPAVDAHVKTLYRFDPLLSAVALATGEEGRVFRDHYARARAVDLDFGNFSDDGLTIATDDNRRGTIVDLGSADELAKRYGYVEPPGGGQGYASIHFVGGRLVITRPVEGTFQPLREIAELLQTPTPAASAPAAVGHVYLVRLLDKLDTGFELLAKVMVIEHKARETCTIRFDVLTR
jgi:hypothetical protein